jgi:hypothetical protein
MIPTTFHEETELLSDRNLNSLKRHYMAFYWKVRKDFLDNVEDSMYHDSSIGMSHHSSIGMSHHSSIGSTMVFLLQVRYFPQVFSHIILRHQRYQRKITHMIFKP